MHKRPKLVLVAAAFIFAALIASFSGCSTTEKSKYVNPDVTADITYTFSKSSVSSSPSDSLGSISGTSVIISSPGTYAFSGECGDGSILVTEAAGDVTLILNSLELSCSNGAPIKLEGSSSNTAITIASGTTNTLSDTDRAEEKPKSVINADGNLTINGTGTLNVNANNKNAIKTDTNLTISEASLIINSVDHGVCADGTLTINSGNFYIISGHDAIKSSPDAVSETLPSVITINGGDFTIISAGDAIASDNELTISGGTFNITAGGAGSGTTDSDLSKKALKASETLTIYDGTFNINSTDDAVHSNSYVYILDGSFTISTGDDAVHADTSLIIGAENGNDDDINIIVEKSYEGLEGGTVYVYSGTIDITSSDDGINAAGGDGSGSTGEDAFNPGGGGGNGPGTRGMNRTNDTASGAQSASGDDSAAAQGVPQTPEGEAPRGDIPPGTSEKDMPEGGMRPEAPTGDMPSSESGVTTPSGDTQTPESADKGADRGKGMGKNAGGEFGQPTDSGAAQGGSVMSDFTIPSDSSEDYAIYIYGGNIKVNAGGDGLDSNGNIYVYGGTTLIFSSENGSNAAIDYGDFGCSCNVTGGTLLAVGFSKMAQTPSSDSTLKYAAFTLSSELKSGSKAVLYDENQNAVFEFEAKKRANHVVFTSEEMLAGTYTLSVDNTTVATYDVK